MSFVWTGELGRAEGDHILVSWGLYTHHGIDLGDGTVVEWN